MARMLLRRARSPGCGVAAVASEQHRCGMHKYKAHGCVVGAVVRAWIQVDTVRCMRIEPQSGPPVASIRAQLRGLAGMVGWCIVGIIRSVLMRVRGVA